MFGNYDLNGAVDQGANMKVLQTVNAKSWLMDLNSVKFEEATVDYSVPISTTQQIIIDPLE